jgi:hypothetical protein
MGEQSIGLPESGTSNQIARQGIMRRLADSQWHVLCKQVLLFGGRECFRATGQLEKRPKHAHY